MPGTRRLAVVLPFAVHLIAVPSAQLAEAPAILRFSFYDSGAIIVPVTIDGAGPYRFQLDTGSTRSAISKRLARQLGATIVGQTVMVTPAGRVPRPIASLKGLQIGRAAPPEVAATVLPDDAFPRAGRVDGLIGQDVLRSLVYTIDYRRRVLVWHDVEAAQLTDSYRLPLTQANGLFFVSVANPARISAVPMRLVADSGADTIVLFDGAEAGRADMTPAGLGMLKTSAGLQLGRRVWLDELDLGGIRLRHQSALVLAHGRAERFLGDGLLPLHLFARVTFNAAGRSITVEAQ